MPEFSFSFRTGELMVLQRALRMYMAFYQEQVGKEQHPGLKRDLQARMEAAETLFRRLHVPTRNTTQSKERKHAGHH